MLEKLKLQRASAEIPVNGLPTAVRQVYRRYRTQDWQDVVIADLNAADRATGVNLKRLRQLYVRCRKMFHEDEWAYDYDPDQYGGGVPPDFDVVAHLQAIQADQKYALVPVDPLKMLRERKISQALKEQLFIKLWDHAGMARQLSYRREDNPGFGEETPVQGLLEEEVTHALYRNGLRGADFELDFNL